MSSMILSNGFCDYKKIVKTFKWLQWYFSTVKWLLWLSNFFHDFRMASMILFDCWMAFVTIKWFQRLSNGFNDSQYFLTAKWFHELIQIASMILFDCQIAFATIKCFHDFNQISNTWLSNGFSDYQMVFINPNGF